MIVTYRRFRRAYLRPLLYLGVFLFLIDAVSLLHSRPETHRATLKPRAAAHDTVYIASVHRNTEQIQREAWNQAVLALVDYLGAPNVHLTAIESGSQEGTKDALLELKAGLDARGVSNHVSLGMTVWEQLDEIDARPPPGSREPGWIWNPAEDQFEMRRIPYLSRVRNQAMAPLKELERQGKHFDKVLWINDVVFDVRIGDHTGCGRGGLGGKGGAAANGDV